MKCYNLGPENKEFGLYTVNQYKITKATDNGAFYWNVEKVKYRETFLLGYLFGLIFWFAVFFWPIIFSYNKSSEEEDKTVFSLNITN